MKRKQRLCHDSSIVEPKYDIVGDHEDNEVRILPARPLNDPGVYADRDLPRPGSAPSLSSISSNSDILPRSPRRECISVPAVNRDLKPSRRKSRQDEQLRPKQPADQCSRRLSPSLPSCALELVNQFPGLTLKDPCWRDGQRVIEKEEFSQHLKGTPTTEILSGSYTNLRCMKDLDERSQQNCERLVPYHNQRPLSGEVTDQDQHDCPPEENAHQICCEADWYVGDFNRVDAEHALHLVNKDGAFLVRNCSVNTSSEPLVLAVYHERKVYNVKIRFIKSVNKYVLGTTGQRSNDMFDSVADIIRFYSMFPITLISGKNTAGSQDPENCILMCPVTKRDVELLLQ